MPHRESDEQIVLLFKNGQEELFKELVNRYTSPLFNFSARLAGQNKAEDLVQEIFLKTWKNINRYNPDKASFKTWIFTIARNTIFDQLRKKRGYSFSELENPSAEDESFAEGLPDENLLPNELLEKLEDTKLLNKSMEMLPSSYREVLVLHYQEEMTFEEIGKVLSKPLNTVKSHHRRAIIKLRNILSDAPN